MIYQIIDLSPNIDSHGKARKIRFVRIQQRNGKTGGRSRSQPENTTQTMLHLLIIINMMPACQRAPKDDSGTKSLVKTRIGQAADIEDTGSPSLAPSGILRSIMTTSKIASKRVGSLAGGFGCHISKYKQHRGWSATTFLVDSSI